MFSSVSVAGRGAVVAPTASCGHGRPPSGLIRLGGRYRWDCVARAAVAISIALAVLELSHPTWTDGSVVEAVQAAGAWWVPLHVLLIVGYGGLVVILRRELIGRPARLLL